jgi:hypothetical protein
MHLLEKVWGFEHSNSVLAEVKKYESTDFSVNALIAGCYRTHSAKKYNAANTAVLSL